MTDETNRRGSASGRVVIKRVGDVETQEWNSATRGSVRWWELIGGDTMATSELVFGIAEIPAGAPRPARGHTHEPAEVYFIISGHGEVFVDGATHPLAPGDAVWIPPNAEHVAYNTGREPLRLAYVFARDTFSEITYCFPGESAQNQRNHA
jgi:mannose-6-phosphate isomerase-like protein (cupin superfamily)